MLGKIRGGSSGGRPRRYPPGRGYEKGPGPLVVLGFAMGLLTVIGYLYDKNYSEISQIRWVVYFTGTMSVVFFFFGFLSKRSKK